MGLYVHSLGEIPENAQRAYYVYLLDHCCPAKIRSVAISGFESVQ